MINQMITFLLGFLSCGLIFYGIYFVEVEVPLSVDNLEFDLEAPSDWIGEKDIRIYRDKVVIFIDDATLSNYAPTGSMRPVLDYLANGIRIVPESEEDVSVGDIVSYRSEGVLIVHRVVEKGFDEKGVYFVLRGDNNVGVDGKVRFEDIEYVTVGVIW